MPLSWSSKRQLKILSALTALVLFLVALPAFFVLYEEPTCSDGNKNQGEQGVDCGGPCPVLCEAEALSPVVHWQRAFKVQDGVYNAVAYVENPNLNSGAYDVPYIFKLYDSENILVQEKRGRADILPRKITGIFESGLLTGKRVPARATFEFSGNFLWVKEEPEDLDVRVVSRILKNEETAPRIDAVVENLSLEEVVNVEIVVIVYNTEGNAMASSKTIVDKIPKEGQATITFTWPAPFGESSGRIETIINR
ncbi:MAG: hypothetical protein Q8P86_01375 [bacterium]|nr:hypothetical protein [bacterium]